MELIRHHLEHLSTNESVVAISVDRSTLSKRRWRGVAGDGREFGFDLDHHLHHGDAVYRDEGICYAVFQTPEEVIEIETPKDPALTAKMAWQIGNLHFPLEVGKDCLRMTNDSAIRQMLEREGITWTERAAVFRPMTAAAHSHHAH